METHVKRDEHGNEVPARLWTSTMRRTKETAQFIIQNKILINGDEFDSGCGSISHSRSEDSSIGKVPSTDGSNVETAGVEGFTQPLIKFEWTQMRPRAWHHLDELFAGECDGMTYEEIEVSLAGILKDLTCCYHIGFWMTGTISR